MNVWLLKIGETMPIVNKDDRLLRMGMIAKELTKRGHKVTWFASTFNHFNKKQLYNKDTVVQVDNNYLIYLFHATGYKKNISIRRVINHKLIALKFRKISKKLEKPDLIYVSFPMIEYAEEAVKYGKKYDIPVVVDVRDLWPDIFKHNLGKILRIVASPYILLLDYKTKKLLKNAFAINSISESMLKWGLKKGNRNEGKFDRCFYIGYDKNDNFDYSNEHLIDLNKFNISFFGTINNQMNYNMIVALARNLYEKNSNIIINICGDGPQCNELKKLAKDCPNIKLLGWMNRNDLNYILHNSSIGLAPYKNTFDFQMSVSNKFAEYLSYGLPIVMTVDGYMKTLLEENNCGISSQDIDKLTDFIVKLGNDKKLYKEMSDNAKKLYDEKFVANRIYSNLVDYLENIKGEMGK